MRDRTPRRRLPYTIAIALGAVVSASGCIGNLVTNDTSEGETDTLSEDTPTSSPSESPNLTNPLGALGALADLANNAESLQTELATMEPVDTVHYSVLLDALPETPGNEWTAGEPRGETNQLGDFSVSIASNTFRRDDGAEIEVTISDFAFNQIAYSGFRLAAAFSQDSTEGYNRGITVGDDPGREEFDYDSQRGSRELLHGKRYHIKVEGDGVAPEDLESWHSYVKTDVLSMP